ncbi:MAG: hypothetical protein ABSH45_17655 [Bryobacteraceae bacterium]
MVKRLIGLVFASALFFSATAEVVVHIRPPRVVIERRLPPPGRDYVWISGYHRWDGNAYAWTPGMWQQPPRRHARWVAHRWTHRRDGWVLVDGHWR